MLQCLLAMPQLRVSNYYALPSFREIDQFLKIDNIVKYVKIVDMIDI